MLKLQEVSLYVCATPIGNQADISKRCLDILSQVDCIYCEDTRVTKTLLHCFGIKGMLKSLNNYNEKEQLFDILKALGEKKAIALVSDAGTPNISDPGAFVVAEVKKAGFCVTPIVGPSSVTALLSICGIRADNYAFMGFFPKKHDQFLNLALDDEIPMVFFETPKRILKTLRFLQDLGVSRFFIAKELTKLHEQSWSSVDGVLKALEADPSKQKGEWCFVLQYKADEHADEGLLEALIDEGFSRKQLLYLKSIGKLHAKRKAIYEHPKFSK